MSIPLSDALVISGGVFLISAWASILAGHFLERITADNLTSTKTFSTVIISMFLLAAFFALAGVSVYFIHDRPLERQKDNPAVVCEYAKADTVATEKVLECTDICTCIKK